MKSGIYTVDKIDNDAISIEMRETLKIYDLAKNDFPRKTLSELKEGDIIELEINFLGKIKSCKILADMTKMIKEENSKKLDSLFDN